MKNFIVILLLLIAFAFSGESRKLEDKTLFNSLEFDKYSQDKEDNKRFYKTDRVLKIIHPIFGAIAYASFLALDGIGIALIYAAFTNQNVSWYEGLKIAHLAVAIPAMLSFATVVTLGYTKAGLKAKAGFKLKKAHLITSFVSVGLYAIELASSILAGVFFANNINGGEWVALSHGIICGLTTVSLSVSIITIFL